MSPLERLQLDIEQCLLSAEEMQYVHFSRIRPREAAEAAGIQTTLDKALSGLIQRNGRQGVSCIIGMPVVEDLQSNTRALRGRLVIPLDVMENIVLNNTGASCEEHAWEMARLLQHMTFVPWSPLVGEPRLMTPRPEAVLNKTVVYRVEFGSEIVARVKEKVADPSVTPNEDGTITLSCSTPGAAIYSTTDGSFPGPGNAAASLYATPLTLVGSGVFSLRAAAFKSGMACSNAVMAEISVE